MKICRKTVENCGILMDSKVRKTSGRQIGPREQLFNKESTQDICFWAVQAEQGNGEKIGREIGTIGNVEMGKNGKKMPRKW